MTAPGSHGWRERLGYQVGMIGFVTVPTLLRLGRYLPGASVARLPRACLIGLLAIATVPLRLVERLACGRRVAREAVAEPPVFIIGHWRSGTTHLHNLMAQDPRFGFVSMYQAIAPGCSLVGARWLKRLLARVVPEGRPMDRMRWPVDAPQEEEIGLGKMLPYSFYVQFLFPRRARALFRRYVLFEGVPARAVEEWKRHYDRLLRCARIHAGGRRLLLKNPVNTARVPLLLELYPDAKFVHIHRSPHDVFPSSLKLHRAVLQLTALETVEADELEETVLDLYETMMRRFLDDRRRIPPGNLVEVAFEDLERDPLGVLAHVYEALGLSGFAEVRPRIERYVASQRGYRKNEFRLTRAQRARVERRWAFAFDALGYHPAAAGGVRDALSPVAASTAEGATP
jgi:hypothetical protein